MNTLFLLLLRLLLLDYLKYLGIYKNSHFIVKLPSPFTPNYKYLLFVYLKIMHFNNNRSPKKNREEYIRESLSIHKKIEKNKFEKV